MPTPMTENELETHERSSEEIDAFFYRNETDEDDYIDAVLRKTEDGRCFRLVVASGFNSLFCGAGRIGEWLTRAELDHWTEFS